MLRHVTWSVWLAHCSLHSDFVLFHGGGGDGYVNFFPCLLRVVFLFGVRGSRSRLVVQSCLTPTKNPRGWSLSYDLRLAKRWNMPFFLRGGTSPFALRLWPV